MKPHKKSARRPQGAAGKEIEVKLRVADRRALRRRLLRLGARAAGARVHEMNILYDTPEGALQSSGRALRVRVERRPASHAGRTTKTAHVLPRVARLTYKGPVKAASAGAAGGSSSYKVREEREVVLTDADVIAGILQGIGLRPSFRYEKYRSAFRLPGLPDLQVDLDETPIGDFLELEGGRDAIDRAAKLLGFGPPDYITLSYPELFVKRASRRPAGKRQSDAPPLRGGGDMLFSAAR
jgi:adenylate cyclase class 2